MNKEGSLAGRASGAQVDNGIVFRGRIRPVVRMVACGEEPLGAVKRVAFFLDDRQGPLKEVPSNPSAISPAKRTPIPAAWYVDLGKGFAADAWEKCGAGGQPVIWATHGRVALGRIRIALACLLAVLHRQGGWCPTYDQDARQRGAAQGTWNRQWDLARWQRMSSLRNPPLPDWT